MASWAVTYFLRNERGLGVKNGTLGTLERIEGSRLTVRLDGPGGAGAAGPAASGNGAGPSGAGQGRAVSFDLAEYADIDHGYAATVHKNQGARARRLTRRMCWRPPGWTGIWSMSR